MEKHYEQFKKCIQKEPPFCQASCPFHVDILDFLEKSGRGAYDAAYKTYRNAVTFPDIVAALCHQPCKNHCPRKEADFGGSAIELRGIERTIIDNTKNKEPVFYNVPKKNHRVAIVGAGISGLACAIRLASKKYQVEVFEKSDRLGGHLWDIADGSPKVGGLTPAIFLEDFDRQMKKEDIILHFNREVDNLENLISEGFNAVYLATGLGGRDFGLIDKVHHYQLIGDTACFAGGSLMGKDTIEALAEGISLAISIEFFLKTGNPEFREDKRNTKTKVDPSKLNYAPGLTLDDQGRIPKENIKDESDRCLKCQCDSCMIYCDLAAFTDKWPLRIKDEVQATMHDGLADVKATPAKRLINICTHCGLCDDVCPENIDMDSMFMQARKELHKLARMPWAFHDFWLRDMEFADGDQASIIKRPPGVDKSSYAFFPGCQLGASDPAYVIESYKWLLSKDPSTAIFLKCCGVPAKWSGDEELHRKTIGRLKSDWEKLGKAKLIIACPNCINNFNEFIPEAETISLYEYMEMVGPPEPILNESNETWSIFDPCATTGKDSLRKSVRNLVAKTKLETWPLPIQEKHSACCSYGGHVSIANPEYADYVVEKRISESHNPYITYCVNCRDSFLDGGKKTIHLLDIFFSSGGKNPVGGNELGFVKTPTVTQRRENRTFLKKSMLKEFWSEEMENNDVRPQINLIISPELEIKLDKERILIEEIAETIEFCEKSGRKIQILGNDSKSGYHRIGHMTYWVEYKVHGDSYELINAYSHRMKIDLEAVWNGKRVDTDV